MASPEEFNIFKDPIKFEKFFRDNYRSFCFLACKYVKNLDIAEEIVQDVFVHIWEKRDSIIVKGSMVAYVSTSVKNNCLNYIKHQTVVRSHEQNEILRISTDASDTEEEMQDLELESKILNAIAELPPQRKKIFTLSRVDGLKYHEIAEKLGLSVKTIEAQMGKALKYLREELKDYIGVLIVLLFLKL